MKFVASYSGGKESALAVYKAINQGHEPVALITTYNTDAGRSHFHGLPEEVLQDVSASLGIPLWLVKTSGEAYTKNFEAALARAKEQGAEACVFGDIDIQGHFDWCSERCNNVGLQAMFPLWGRQRRDVVYELIDLGFTANISVINATLVNEKMLGQKLTKDITEAIAAGGADICGENGEYHTFVSDGPIFRYPVSFAFGEKAASGDYAMLGVLPVKKNSHSFFANRECQFFPCHKSPCAGEFNCLFCYCPLYPFDHCGGNFEYAKGLKICVDCDFPHRPESYDFIVEWLRRG